MRGLPKRIVTKTDLNNCINLVRNGQGDKNELIKLINGLVEKNYITCPVREVSQDGSTITINYCNEANIGDVVRINGEFYTITNVTHYEADNDNNNEINISNERISYNKTEVEISDRITDEISSISIRIKFDAFDFLDKTEEQLNELMEELRNE